MSHLSQLLISTRNVGLKVNDGKLTLDVAWHGGKRRSLVVELGSESYEDVIEKAAALMLDMEQEF